MKKVLILLLLLLAGCGRDITIITPEGEFVVDDDTLIITVESALAGVPHSPRNTPLLLLRANAVEGYANYAAITTALAGAIGDYAHKPSGAIRIPPGTTVVTLYVCGTTTDDDTLSVVPYGLVDDNGPIEIICDAAGIIGTQDVVLYPHDGSTATNAFWVDSWTITNDYWRTSIGVLESLTDGGLSVTCLTFDPLNLGWLGCYVHSANGGVSAGEADTVAVYVQFLVE